MQTPCHDGLGCTSASSNGNATKTCMRALSVKAMLVVP